MIEDRRTFMKKCAVLGASVLASGPAGAALKPGARQTLAIEAGASNFEREPLIRPFGFKGGYMREIWQSAVSLQGNGGFRKTGIGTQSVLWSDARVFAGHSESGGNALMYAMTEHAVGLVKGRSFTDPVAMVDEIWPQVHEYGKKICGLADLRDTFALNAMVPVDNAAWLIYAAANRHGSFDDMIPEVYRPALAYRHRHVAAIPLMAYAIPVGEIVEAANEGYFFMKIKIGQPGSQDEMLEKDMARLTGIHKAIGHMRTHHTEDGRIPYYFDANGRYESADHLMRLLDHARRIGAFDQIALIEEPFDEHLEIDVRNIPVRLAADESAHTDRDALARIEMGYGAIAVKAIAKTLSMTLKIARVAHESGVPCFCADLTVNPILVEWNKNVAARLAPFPGIGLGLLETNGHQNYLNWEAMLRHAPSSGHGWACVKDGVFELDEDYYRQSGGIFMPSPHYEAMFAEP